VADVVTGARDLVGFFEEMSRAEAEYADRLRRLAERLHHPVLRALILAVAMDSEKHSQLYRALAELARGSPVLTEEELEAIRRELKEHLEEEAKDYAKVREILESRRDLDPRVKLLLAAIMEDERVHHKLLEAIYEHVDRKEVISEEEFWESVWMDAPYHGAPGG
jgi:rubrerythrin